MTQGDKDHKQALKELNKFKKAYQKLLAKNPNICVYGDRDGEPTAHIYVGPGPYGKTLATRINNGW